MATAPLSCHALPQHACSQWWKERQSPSAWRMRIQCCCQWGTHSLWWCIYPWSCCHLHLYSPWGLAWSLHMKARGFGCWLDSKKLDWGLRWNRQKQCQGRQWVLPSWGHWQPCSAAYDVWWHALLCSQVPTLLWVERKCPLEWTGA